MRVLLMGLFLLNFAVGGLAALEYFQRDKSVDWKGVETLQLLDSVSVRPALNKTRSPDASGENQMITSPQEDTVFRKRQVARINDTGSQATTLPVCLAFGPIKDRAIFQEIVRLLSSYGLSFEEDLTQTDSLPEYWVIMPPFQSRELAETQISYLADLGFESFYITHGENRGGISLGLFQSQAPATELMLSLSSKKIHSKIKELDNSSPEYRLTTRSAVPSGTKDELVGVLNLYTPPVKYKEIICK